MQDFFDLTTIGATDAVFEAFQPYAARGLLLGRVSVVHSDRYRLYTGRARWPRKPSVHCFIARSGQDGPRWATGSRCSRWDRLKHARRNDPCRAAAPDHVLPAGRRGSREQQVVAANIDLALIVCGLDRDFNVRRIERYLTLAHASGVEAAIVLNKSDVCADLSARRDEAARVAGDAPVMTIAARSAQGIEPVLRLLRPGLTVALLGSSGVGKSTLVNQLLGVNRQLVREVRESDSRGRHTTTYRELLPLPQGGALIDTPGVRELQLWADQDSLDSAFAEIANLAAAVPLPRLQPHSGSRLCGAGGNRSGRTGRFPLGELSKAARRDCLARAPNGCASGASAEEEMEGHP